MTLQELGRRFDAIVERIVRLRAAYPSTGAPASHWLPIVEDVDELSVVSADIGERLDVDVEIACEGSDAEGGVR